MQAVTAVADFGQRVRVQMARAPFIGIGASQIVGTLEAADSTGLAIADARPYADHGPAMPGAVGAPVSDGPVFIPWAHVLYVVRYTPGQDIQP